MKKAIFLNIVQKYKDGDTPRIYGYDCEVKDGKIIANVPDDLYDFEIGRGMMAPMPEVMKEKVLAEAKLNDTPEEVIASGSGKRGPKPKLAEPTQE